MSPTRLEGVAVVRERATSHGLVGPSRNRFILVRGDGLPSYSIWSPAMNETRAPDSSSRTHCRRRTSVRSHKSVECKNWSASRCSLSGLSLGQINISRPTCVGLNRWRGPCSLCPARAAAVLGLASTRLQLCIYSLAKDGLDT
jgi:hypothetical protein